ncbi:glucose 1-dehydrogenase [Pseudooceanicola sp. 216_PA32_1]|uniref:Glucose 1-dehydrogenase n=1 Tax=Pseudooceanicola pacificus TaxID=2676438 RepID=A0A844W2C8_9RHOB|nr:glucose 1-dehydrogenase [Pseudooceanicola pacificus]MWB78306.1 glucose 1-dehydrogenase [Pseudooceanicola pacificus]
MQTLNGQVAWVTGASRGIGAQTARLLASRGAAIVVGYGNAQAEARTVAESIIAAGGRAVISGGDLRQRETAEAAVRAALDNFGRLDILVTAAGVNHWGGVEQITEEEVSDVIEVNLLGTLLSIQAAVPGMSDGARIVTVSSRLAQNPQAGSALYSASKAAVIALTESCAKELGPRGIRVNSVAPGLVETDMTREAVAARGASVAQQTPFGRIGQPEDIARAIAMLVSQDAQWITGRTLRADGGLT